MLEATESHIRHVNSVVQQRPDSGQQIIDSPITRSWIRCFNEYRLEPDHRVDPVLVERSELQDRQERLSDVLTFAKPEMANLYQQLAGSGYAIMLTDCDGVVLNYFCDPELSHTASKSGLLQGATWSERNQGTNGIGTCLLEKAPLVIHRNEHFLVRHINITSSAAPIFNHRGDVIAVLDASGQSERDRRHTLSLVKMSAQTIENHVFLHQFRHEFLLHFHSRSEFVGTLYEGVIALDPAGRVLAATRTASFQLGASSAVELCGRNISELFNVPLARLVDTSARKDFRPVSIFEVHRGGRYFALVRPPEPARIGALHSNTRCSRKQELDSLASRHTPLDDLEFGDAFMHHNIQAAKRVLERDVPILLYGETGTGKEMFAKALHLSGSRARKPFIAINCASIPESLIESELFGYKAGAFTGASREGQRGKIFQANGGTLFLDEIGDMPILLQARLLRVLEEREVLPLGGETPVKVDIRLISATHCDLPKKIAAGEFREDLYYRLQGVTLTLPPLRERTDRRALIKRILANESGEEMDIDLDDRLLDALDKYRWPGNLRQLRNVLRTMVALRSTDRLTLEDLPPELSLLGGSHNAYEEQAGATVAAAAELNVLESAERDALIRELEHHHWNITTVAKKLKMSRNTLYRTIQRLNIKNTDRNGSY